MSGWSAGIIPVPVQTLEDPRVLAAELRAAAARRAATVPAPTVRSGVAVPDVVRRGMREARQSLVWAAVTIPSDAPRLCRVDGA